MSIVCLRWIDHGASKTPRGVKIYGNQYLDFGSGRDAEAIRKRLCIFATKALPTKYTNVSGRSCYSALVHHCKKSTRNVKIVNFNTSVISAWLHLNCMEIFHYVALQLQNIFKYGDDTCNTPGCLNAVKVGFVVCKGVFVAYIFYCTNQCAFI